MKNYILISTLLLSYICNSQNDADINNYISATKSIREKWKYFKMKDTIEVKIIKHFPAIGFCGIGATASMTIVETKKGDTIRVIDLCNVLDNYKINQIIRIFPEEKPKLKFSLPFEFKKNEETGQMESISKNYDSTIF